MHGFGRFEAVDQLASFGQVEVSAARPAGESAPARFVIKSFSTQSDFADPEVVERGAQDFLERVKLQAALAKAAPERWAPVHESGRTETHAYVVTDLYDLTGDRLIESRRELSARGIVDVVGGVADALADVHAALGGRAHGAIKPGNVMLSGGDEGLAGARVFLTDPAAPGQLDKNSGVDDIRQIAGFMHLIVTHRPAPKGGAVERSEDWTRLGGQGEALRAVCEQLLNPTPGQALPTPAEIRARLRECLKAKGAKKGPNKVLIGVIAAAVVLGGGAGAYFLLGPGGGGVVARQREDRRLDPDAGITTPAQWLAGEEQQARAIITQVDARLDAGEATFTDEDAAAWDRAKQAFESAASNVATQREVAWPADEAPDIADRQIALNRAFGEADQGLRGALVTLRRAGDALKALTPEDDPRVPRPAIWAQRLRERVSDEFSRSAAEMRDDGGEGDAKVAQLEKVRDELLAQIGELAGLEWNPRGEVGPDGQPDPEAARVRQENQRRIKEAIRPEAGGVALRDRVEAFVTRAKREASESRSGVERALAAALERWRTPASDGPGASAAIREAAAARIGRIQRRFEEGGARAGLAQTRRDLAGVEDWARRLYEQVPGFTPPSVPAGSGVTVEPLLAEMAQRREAAWREAAGAVLNDDRVPDAGDEAYWGGVARRVTEMTAFGQQGSALITGGLAMEAMLALAYAPDEAGADNATLIALRDRARSSPAFAAAGVCVEPVLARVAALERIAGLGSEQALLAAIAEAANGQDAPGAVTAWRALLKREYPARAADLGTLAAVRADAYERALAGVRDAGRRAALSRTAAEDVKRAWFDVVQRRANGVVSEVEGAFEAMATAGVTPADLQNAPAWVRRNLARYEFAQRVRAVADAKAEDQIGQVSPIVRAWLQSEQGAGVASGWEGLYRALAPIGEGKVTDLTKDVGPARVGWRGRFGPGEDGSVMFYSWTAPSGRSYDLEFVRIADSADGAVYLCTEEVSVGLFLDVLGEANQWDTIAQRHPNLRIRGLDTRRGVVVWTWMEGRTPEINSSSPSNGNGWLPPAANLPQTGYYADGAAPADPPGATTPVNAVPPPVAVLAASWAGCRLPTPEEWRLGLDRTGSIADANRRDATWASQHAYIASQHAIQVNNAFPYRALQFPNEGIVRPEPRSERPEPGSDGAPARPDSDGVLWFRPVNAGDGRFRNIVGNVAEWVYANASSLDALEARTSLANATQALGTGYQGLGVIGASALSPASIDPLVVLACRPAQQGGAGFTSAEANGRGFSDVGFRLAFSSGAGGGAGTPRDRVLAALGATSYLTGD